MNTGSKESVNLKRFNKSEEDKNEQNKYAARQFAKEVYSMYGDKSMSLDAIFEKAGKLAEKRKLNSAVMGLFIDFYPTIANRNHTPEDYWQTSRIGKVLGRVFPSHSGVKGSFKLEEKDKESFNAIKRMANDLGNKNSLAHAAYQTMTYQKSDVIIQSKFAAGRHDPSSHVHPVIAALFINKIPFLERRILTSDLAGMITGLSEKKGPRTWSDYEFMVDIGRDTNSHICDGNSIFKDLKKRCEVQIMLRNIVHQFRNGIVYNPDFRSFMMLMQQCQMTPNDHPHLIFMRDEGVLMSRILNMFSLRPIKIITNQGVTAVNGANRLPFPFRPVSERGFIEVRIPYPRAGVNPAGMPGKSLTDGLRAPMWQIYGNTMMPQNQNIWFCQDMLIFYVNRRYPSVQWQQQSYTYTRLPTLVTGQDRCNTYPVKVEHVLPNVGGHKYHLQSCVVLNTQTLNLPGQNAEQTQHEDVITGCSTIFVRWPGQNDQGAYTQPQYYWYDPLYAVNVMDAMGNPIAEELRRPVTRLNRTQQNGGEGFDELASTRGTIFIYSRQQ